MDYKEILKYAVDFMSWAEDEEYIGSRKILYIKTLWKAYLENDLYLVDYATESDVAIMLALANIASIRAGDNVGTNYIQAAGYIAIAGQYAMERERRAEMDRVRDMEESELEDEE